MAQTHASQAVPVQPGVLFGRQQSPEHTPHVSATAAQISVQFPEQQPLPRGSAQTHCWIARSSQPGLPCAVQQGAGPAQSPGQLAIDSVGPQHPSLQVSAQVEKFPQVHALVQVRVCV